uniref:Protein kinase domain-containing protein n=1 Tax=Xenopus tropicalis TaxID=8364 RepID=A0A1B8Y0Y4_XENTR
MGAKLCNILHQQQNTEAEDTNQCFDYSELLAMKHQLVSTIQKEMRVAAGAENLYRATKNRKTKAQVKELRKSSEEKVKALYSSLLKLTQEIARKEAENTRELQFCSFNATDFRRIQVLGRGSFGKVLLVEYLPANIICALKVLKKDNINNEEEIQRILAEKQIGQLVNPDRFLVDLYATFTSKYHLFFIMEFVAGGTLRTHLESCGHFDLEKATFYAACITLGLSAIHTKDVIHRDLKPGNLLIDKAGYLKIADFGMGKTGIGYGDRTSTILGTPAYMAPELVKEEQYTRAVDWWALGVIVYEMLLGTRPFTGMDIDFMYEWIEEDEPHYPDSLEPQALSFISQLLMKNPEERLGSTQDDAEDVAHHPFFNNTAWDDIIDGKATAPFVPSLNGPEDVSYFAEKYTKLPANLTLPKGPCAEMADDIEEAFQDFNFSAF